VPKTREIRKQTNWELRNKEITRRGECALHLEYWGCKEYVMQGFEYLFDLDHIDRTTKVNTVSKMKYAKESDYLKELAKCQLLCMKCHRRKTVEQRDWETVYKECAYESDGHLTLFDI
jgi:hypothetical protein